MSALLTVLTRRCLPLVLVGAVAGCSAPNAPHTATTTTAASTTAGFRPYLNADIGYQLDIPTDFLQSEQSTDGAVAWLSPDKTSTVQVLVATDDPSTAAEQLDQCRKQLTMVGGHVDRAEVDDDRYVCIGTDGKAGAYAERGIVQAARTMVVIWACPESDRMRWDQPLKHTMASFAPMVPPTK